MNAREIIRLISNRLATSAKVAPFGVGNASKYEAWGWVDEPSYEVRVKDAEGKTWLIRVSRYA